MKTLLPLVLFSLLWLPADPPTRDDAVTITEWPVPYEDSRPRDPYVGGQDRVWFVGQKSDYVAYLNPEDDTFERYDLEAGAGPHNLIVADDGMVWYAGNRAAHIGRLDPATGDIEKFDMPETRARDPHTLVFDPAGDIWFTVQGGGYVGKLTTETGSVELIEVPTDAARPYGIITDPEGRPWFVEFGSYKLGTVDPETMDLREIPLPREEARPRRLARTSDGLIWYVDYAQGYLGRYDPATEQFKEWRLPGGADARPYGMVADAQGRLWFVETGLSPNRFVGFDPAAEAFFSTTEIESGGGSVRHMFFHEAAQEIWFGTDANTIGRATLQ